MLYKKVTFLTAMELWREKAETCGFSPKTIRNTETTLKMLLRFVSPKMDLRSFSAAEYGRVLKQIKMSGYAAETICDLNATLKKLVNLAFKKRLIRRNVLAETDNLRVASQSKARVIPREHFLKIIAQTRRREYRFLLTLLYCTGMRIGEALALKQEDFLDLGGAMKVRVDKSYLHDFKMMKTTKNFKVREIPISTEIFDEFLQEMSMIRAREQSAQSNRGGFSGRIFVFSPQAARAYLHKICAELGLPKYRLHDFRHTFVSNLIRSGVPLPVVAQVSGDTQTTLLKRYSHAFPNDDQLIIEAVACASGNAAKPT